MRSRSGFRAFAWAILSFNVLVVLWGAYVRATGSGAGCGNHWPLCNGEMMPRSATLATLIEYTHRASSGLALIGVLALVIWAFRAFPVGHAVRRWATLSLVFILTEALLGAGLVLLEHVAQNVSLARGWSISLHLVNTLTLLGMLALTARGSPIVPGRSGMWAALGAFLLIGVSGAIAALGDTLFPASSLATGLRDDFAPGAHLFLRLRWLHPLIAASVSGWLLYEILRFGRSRFALALTGLLLTQAALGVVNVLLLAPVWMQIVHLLAADLLWIGMVLYAAGPSADTDGRAMS